MDNQLWTVRLDNWCSIFGTKHVNQICTLNSQWETLNYGGNTEALPTVLMADIAEKYGAPVYLIKKLITQKQI